MIVEYKVDSINPKQPNAELKCKSIDFRLPVINSDGQIDFDVACEVDEDHTPTIISMWDIVRIYDKDEQYDYLTIWKVNQGASYKDSVHWYQTEEEAREYFKSKFNHTIHFSPHIYKAVDILEGRKEIGKS
jgi:hypothetical protein